MLLASIGNNRCGLHTDFIVGSDLEIFSRGNESIFVIAKSRNLYNTLFHQTCTHDKRSISKKQMTGTPTKWHLDNCNEKAQ